MLQNESFSSLENDLAGVLTPVKPSQKFVNNTKNRLHFVSPVVVAKRVTDGSTLLITVASVVSVSLLLIVGIRALFYLTGRSK